MSIVNIVVMLVIFCLVMLGVVIRLWYRQHQKRQHNQKNVEHLVTMLDEQRQHRIDSINVIARAMQAKQCELAEGCIRLTMLIEQVNDQLLSEPPFDVFKVVHQQTDHMPIKEAWKQLDRTVKAKLTKERHKIEDRHRPRIDEALAALIIHQF